ncbi:phosphatidylserine synthase 2 [Nematostella vectensis]|uniref:phosphatidylserine synthase 2 n=1 Tax=Nematostella vectensis TaxID=45351 RepID=UPI0020779C04|nr:phosphatidylserine synthase 2 [Nematostella vectensis]XP_048585169.1 phosphatidylserine synthase 2 [Nematostella vectensis]
MAKLKEIATCSCVCNSCCCRASKVSGGERESAKALRANGTSHVDSRPFSIACEWDRNKTQQFTDDGTNTYFWQAHTITVLIGLICVLIYVALFEQSQYSSQYNTKRGLFACFMVFLLFGVTQIRDGPFKRPHPAFWRLMLCLSVLYELALIFILFQSVDDARQLLKYIDKSLGEPLPEVSYGEDCAFYTPGHPDGPFHNFLQKFDIFVFAHLCGWWAKALMIRDYWLCIVISVLFEVLEYTLEHQLPNFCECWWDHWIMDVLVCNAIGTYLGMKTCDYLSIKPFHWRGLWNIPSYSGKLKRVAQQFTPYSWTAYDWGATKTLKRWLAVCGITAVYLTAELTLFYLKFILWIPPPHFLNWMRVILFLFIGSVALNETYEYMFDENVKRFGQQAWVVAAIIATEVLICLKFDPQTIFTPFPPHITAFWAIGLISMLVWTVWNFWSDILSGFYLSSPKHAKKTYNAKMQYQNGKQE